MLDLNLPPDEPSPRVKVTTTATAFVIQPYTLWIIYSRINDTIFTSRVDPFRGSEWLAQASCIRERPHVMTSQPPFGVRAEDYAHALMVANLVREFVLSGKDIVCLVDWDKATQRKE